MTDEDPPSNKLISLVNTHYQNLLGYHPIGTKLIRLDSNEMEEFCRRFGLNKNSRGIYLPRNQTAVIQSGEEDSGLNLFHEYFGHGMFCERTLNGKRLVKLERRLMKEERQFFGECFSQEELEEFRKNNPLFYLLQKEKDENQGNYETFAVWTEKYLSEVFGLEDLFRKRYERLSEELKINLSQVSDLRDKYGELTTFYSFGFARMMTIERVKELLREIYKDSLKDVRFAVLYGSKKPFSDVDVFMVGEDLPEVNNSWIDVRVERVKDFEEQVRNFDVSIVNPMLDSDYLFGDERYFRQKRKQLVTQPITEETIRYNLRKLREQRRFALMHPEYSKERKHGLSYVKTYLGNALLLRKKRSLGQGYSPDESFIELKRGEK